GNHGNEYLNSNKFRTEYVNAESHEAREAVVKKYDDYVDNAGEAEQPGVWDNIGAFTASAMPSRNEVDEIRQDSVSHPSPTPAPVRTEERQAEDRSQRVDVILNEFRTRHAENRSKNNQGGKGK
ncbi:MAG: hypothetical protein LUD81_03185, partial [Clostridiales bacterium]|nr:hypothetical protein [Clostridiales bacterium]